MSFYTPLLEVQEEECSEQIGIGVSTTRPNEALGHFKAFLHLHRKSGVRGSSIKGSHLSA